MSLFFYFFELGNGGEGRGERGASELTVWVLVFMRLRVIGSMRVEVLYFAPLALRSSCLCYDAVTSRWITWQ